MSLTVGFPPNFFTKPPRYVPYSLRLNREENLKFGLRNVNGGVLMQLEDHFFLIKVTEMRDMRQSVSKSNQLKQKSNA